MFLVTNETALEMNGLCCAGLGPLRIAKCANNPIRIRDRRVVPTESKTSSDLTHFVRTSDRYPEIIIPSAERAIVDSILNIDSIDEEYVVESIFAYLGRVSNLRGLYEVADFFSLKRNILDHWIAEAQAFED